MAMSEEERKVKARAWAKTYYKAHAEQIRARKQVDYVLMRREAP